MRGNKSGKRKRGRLETPLHYCCFAFCVAQATYGVAPDAMSYNAVISGHERAGEWREALALARKMERLEGVAPTIVTFNSVIGACKRAGKATEALAVLGLLRRKGLHPDVISFNSAISACARCARFLWGVWRPSDAYPGGGDGGWGWYIG